MEFTQSSFEAWLKKDVYERIRRYPDLTKHDDGTYINHDHEIRWQAWQAACHWIAGTSS